MKVESESEVPQSSLTLHDAMDFSLPGSFVHGIFQARVLEWGAIAFSKSVLKEINPECSLEGLIPKLKLQYFGCLMRRDDSLEKTLMIERLQQEKGATANEMVG